MGIDEVVEWLDPLVLEEIDAALNARPRLAIDPIGGFIVTDGQESQVRVYGPQGQLLTYFGREGEGPGEFRNLRIAIRLPDGRFCALDRDGRVSLWSPQGELLTDFLTELRGVLSAAAMGNSRVAVVTTPNVPSMDDLAAPMVHVLDLDERSVVTEFLTLPLTRANVVAALTVEGSVASISGSTFGVTWTVFDSLWVVDLARGSVSRTLHLESAALRANAPPVDRLRDPRGFGEWIGSTTFPGTAYPAPGGGWLVNLYSLGPGGVSGLLRVDSEGRRVWEIEDAPRLLAVEPPTGVLFFAEPSGLVPNSFQRARLRN